MYKFWCTVCLFFTFSCLSAQVFYKAANLKLGTPYLEPDGRNLSLKLNEEEFVTLAKVKGGVFGPSVYQLEKLTKELEVLFSVQLNIPFEEDFFKLASSGTHLRIFSAVHDSRALTSQCKVATYNLTNGKFIEEKILAEFTVKPWLQGMSTGMVEEDFITTINAAQPRDFVTPLEYEYKINFSPDGKKLIVYSYDYAQKNLLARAFIFDEQLNLLQKGIVPIDNNFVNYGLHVNNRGELFILNADKGGRIALIKYDMETKDNIFLDIASSSNRRYNFKLRFLNDDEVYVINLSSRSDKLVGIMYSKFNFKEKLIDKINHHDLSEGMIQTSKILRQYNKLYEAEDDWMNYAITDVFVNEYEKIILILEKQKIESTMFNYQFPAVNHIDSWYEKSGKISTGPVMLFSFNADDMLLWETYHLKNQTNDISQGLLSSSYSAHLTEQGMILMVYASSSGNNSSVYNEITYVQFEEASGSKIKELKLENKEEFSMLRDYTVWFDDSFVIGARKGLFGKKSSLFRYNVVSQ